MGFMINRDTCLLLTGCISPAKGVYALHVKDSDIRKQQYFESMEFYIKKTAVKKIVYCDNSDPKEIKEIAELAVKYNKVFEWLSFQGDEQKTIEKGKGYGEGEILKYACENSKIMQTCKSIIKVTGRLKVTNLNILLRILCSNNNYFNLYINKENKRYADTRFFVIKIEDFQRYLISEYENVDDRQGQILEICFAQKIIESKMPYKLFPTYIGYEGISGSSGVRYALTLAEKADLFLKVLWQRLFCKRKIYDSMEFYRKGIVLDDSIWDQEFHQFTHKKVAIYGAGLCGRQLYKLCVKHCNVVIWTDTNYKKIKRRCGRKIDNYEKMQNLELDCVIVAINNSDIFREIRSFLKEYEIRSDILWFNGHSLEHVDG